MNEKDIMNTLNSWANEFGEDELKTIFENINNLKIDGTEDKTK